MENGTDRRCADRVYGHSHKRPWLASLPIDIVAQ